MRNPERIDLKKYPPPPGYVAASDEDIKAAGPAEPRNWMWFSETREDWVGAMHGFPIDKGMTYLRPITPEDQGDKYDTDHMFWG